MEVRRQIVSWGTEERVRQGEKGRDLSEGKVRA